MNYSTFTLGILVLVMTAAGIGNLIGNIQENYASDNNVSINTTFVETYAQVEIMVNKTEQLNNQVQGEGPEEGDITTALLKQGATSIQIMYGGISLTKAMVNDFSVTLGIPTYITGTIIAMLIVALAYLAMTILTKTFQRL